jgi:hypothetical protein
MTTAKIGFLTVVLSAAIAGACATGPVYTKKTDRESATIDALDCSKTGILAHRAARSKFADPTTPEARQAAAKAASAAWRRCLVRHGWKERKT